MKIPIDQFGVLGADIVNGLTKPYLRLNVDDGQAAFGDVLCEWLIFSLS